MTKGNVGGLGVSTTCPLHSQLPYFLSTVRLFVGLESRGFLMHLKRPPMHPNIRVVMCILTYLFAKLSTLIKVYRHVKSYARCTFVSTSGHKLDAAIVIDVNLALSAFEEIAIEKTFIWNFILKLQTGKGCTKNRKKIILWKKLQKNYSSRADFRGSVGFGETDLILFSAWLWVMKDLVTIGPNLEL